MGSCSLATVDCISMTVTGLVDLDIKFGLSGRNESTPLWRKKCTNIPALVSCCHWCRVAVVVMSPKTLQIYCPFQTPGRTARPVNVVKQLRYLALLISIYRDHWSYIKLLSAKRGQAFFAGQQGVKL